MKKIEGKWVIEQTSIKMEKIINKLKWTLWKNWKDIEKQIICKVHNLQKGDKKSSEKIFIIELNLSFRIFI